ncbi:MAG: HD domain-containing protein [Gammaproteobacteria bacterium]|nr:HD domain-containing protein [Gammaproteobacteria bacterium]MBU1480737.1 HD domain-containing protein [Gammaproteobacteria bacterium]
MKQFFPNSLRAKILLLLTMLFVLFVGQATFKAILNFNNIKHDRQIEFQSTARWIESEQHRHLAQARMVAFVAMNQIRKGLTRGVCQHGVVGEPGLDPEFGQFAIAAPDGKLSCNSIPWLKTDNVANENYFKEAMKLADVGFISQAGNQSGQYRSIMARSMRNDGRSLSVILVAMDFSWTKEEVEMSNLPEGSHLLLVDAGGTVIAASHNAAGWIDKSLTGTPFYKQILADHDSAFDGSGFGGMPSVVVAHQFETGAGDMRVIIDAPNDVLLQPAYRSLTSMLLFSVLVFGLVLSLAYYWIDKYLLRKVSAIVQATQKLGRGDLTARVALTGEDELGHLAQSFDKMAATLEANVAEIKAAHEELHRVNRSLRVLSAGNKSLLFAKTEQELLERICREIVEAGGYLAAWIGFTGPEQDKFLRTAASYSRTENESHKIDWNKAGNGLDPVITSVRENKVLVINDTGNEAVHKSLGEHAAKFGYRSVIILPLHLEGSPFGALILCAHGENEFGDVQVEYLKETAADTSFGIEMLRTKGERNRLALLEEHHESMLRDSLEDALRAISLTIEMRDPYTSGHQRRVADLADALARELGMSADEVHGIYLAAIVHDIGKINVPAEILVKPGKLNEMEYALVKNHVVSSYEILKGIKFPWPLADMVKQHHERLDGSGYPHGLNNGAILFGARILAVADVVEAMSSHRPYRPGLGTEAALEEIEKGRVRLFDEAVVDACLKLFRDGRFVFNS